MPSKLTFIYLSAIFILYLLRFEFYHSYSDRPEPELIQNKREILGQKLSSKNHTELLLAYNTGYKKHLSRKLKNNYRLLNLYHLFTPSGIHLSAIYLLLFPLLKLIRKKSKKIFIITNNLLCLAIMLLPGSYSLKRISLLRLIHFNQRFLPFRIGLVACFMIAFVLDYLFGTFADSPLSFAYSYLFLGIIITMATKPKLLLPFALMGGQIIVSYFQQTPLTYWGGLAGFFLTAIFSLLFPVFFLFFWIPCLPLEKLTAFILNFYQLLVNSCAAIAKDIGYFESSILLLILVPFITLRISLRTKAIGVVLFVLFHSNPALNLPRHLFKRSIPAVEAYPPATEVKSIKRNRNGYSFQFYDGVKCQLILLNGYYQIKYL